VPALSDSGLPGSTAPEPPGTPPGPPPAATPPADPAGSAGDAERPTPPPPSSTAGAEPAGRPANRSTAGVRDQLGRTVRAGRRLLDAHLALARLELAGIGREIGQLAGKIAAAVALLLMFVGILVPVGSALFLGEWLFGSMAWGIAHGALSAIALAVVLVVSGLRVSTMRIAGATVIAFLLGLLAALGLGLGWAHEAWRIVGETVLAGIDPANQPLLAAVLFVGGLGAIAGLLAGARLAAPGEGVMGAVFGLLAGVVIGALLGALTAITYPLQAGVALGIVFGLVCWSGFTLLTLQGFDWEAFGYRFVPSATIDTTQETIEWIRTRMPGPKA
jgi:hypothetical protein